MKFFRSPLPFPYGWDPAPELETRRPVRELRFKEGITQLVILLLALISGAMTFEGAYLLNLRVGGQSFATVASAGLLAIGITAGIMTAWWVMMSVIPNLRTGRAILSGLALIFSLQGWMLSVSSTNNVIALGAQDGIISYMERSRTVFFNAISAAQARAIAIKPYLGILKGEAEGRCGQAEGERMRGSTSGSAGAGAISGILDLLCTQSMATVLALEESVRAAEERGEEADLLLRRLEAVIWDHDKPVFAREMQFFTTSSELRAWLRATSGEDLTRTLKSAHALMAAGVTPPSLASGQFAGTQKALIEGLRASVDETGKRYSEIAGELSAAPVPQLPASTRISLIEAVWQGRVGLAPQIAAAIGIDFFQLFMVLAFLLARSKAARTAPTG